MSDFVRRRLRGGVETVVVVDGRAVPDGVVATRALDVGQTGNGAKRTVRATSAVQEVTAPRKRTTPCKFRVKFLLLYDITELKKTRAAVTAAATHPLKSVARSKGGRPSRAVVSQSSKSSSES